MLTAQDSLTEAGVTKKPCTGFIQQKHKQDNPVSCQQACNQKYSITHGLHQAWGYTGDQRGFVQHISVCTELKMLCSAGALLLASWSRAALASWPSAW